MDISTFDYTIVYTAVFQPMVHKVLFLLSVVLTIFLAVFVYALLKYRVNLLRISIPRLESLEIRMQLLDFLRWLAVDLHRLRERGLEFNQFGFTIYCGRQGAGKTTAMVYYLWRMHRKYPKALIVTNFACSFAHRRMEDWRDLMDIRNGEDGVIFAIDEIHSEYSNASWKDFPESLLSEISQQRKQRVKIVATSQVYGRVVKQIREQCATVVQCMTFARRWTFCKEYDAVDYEQANGEKKKMRTRWRWSFIQSDRFRTSFDTYEKIKRLAKTEFIPRAER